MSARFNLKDKRSAKRIRLRKKAGLCICCGKVPPQEGLQGCEACYKQHADYKLDHCHDLRDLGFCVQCRDLVEDRNPLTKKRYARCKTCRAYQNKRHYGYHLKVRAKKEKAKACLDCNNLVTKLNPTTGKLFRRCFKCRVVRAAKLRTVRMAA